MARELLNCPHCDGKARLHKESKHYTRRLNKKVQYSRIVCENNNPHDASGNRCLCKTVAAPTDEVIKHWNRRR